jgi:hypothetical protein
MMITFRISADVTPDRRVVLTLPPEVPLGQAELVVTVEDSARPNQHPQTNLADWVEIQLGPNGSVDDRYSLRGSVVRFDRPTDPVGDEDWEATR